MASDTFLPKVGGAEVHVHELAETLIRRGHQVCVLTATQGPGHINGLSTLRFPLLRTRTLAKAAWHYLYPLKKVVAEYDLVHAHYTALVASVVGALAKWMHKPVVVTLHGYGTLDSSAHKTRWLSVWRKCAFQLADKVIATSSELAEVAKRYVRPDKIILIPNGVDTKRFQPSRSVRMSGRVTIATVRRLVPKNGVQYLVEAAPLVLARAARPVEFWIIGDGSLRQFLEQRVAALGLTPYFRFWGAVNHADIPRLVEQVDIVVFPSTAESTSLAALEAMSLAKAVVATNVGAYPELLGENERGYIVPLFDSGRSSYDAPISLPPDRLLLIAETIVALVNSPEIVHTLGLKAREHVVSFYDWEVLARRVEDVYREALDGRRTYMSRPKYLRIMP